MCQTQGDYEPSILLHASFTCPTAQGIIRYICTKLTHEVNISPIEVILTNAKCTKNWTKGQNCGNEQHPICSVFDNFNEKPSSLDFTWSIVTKYIMTTKMN